jgi:cell division septal protein FtsQ
MTRDFKDIGPSAFSLKPEKPKPKRRETARRAKSLLVALLILACVGALLFGATRAAPLLSRAISGSPYFRLEGVDVIGVLNADRGEIAAAIGFEPGAPIFDTDLAALRERIRSVDWVKDAQVRRRLPNRLVVSIVEHEPVGVTVVDGAFFFVDKDGELFCARAEAVRYPVFFGMRTKEEFADGAALTLLLYEKDIVALDSIASVVYDAAMGYTVTTRGGVLLRFGAGPFDQKIERLIAVLPDAERRGPIEYIYLDIDGRITVKNGTPIM